MDDGGRDSLSMHPRLLRLNVVLLAAATLAWVTLFCDSGGPCCDRPRHPHSAGMTREITALRHPGQTASGELLASWETA